MTRLCLQENQMRYIKEVTLYCEDIKEPGQYICENYPNHRPKGKRASKKKITKPSPRKNTTKRKFAKKKTSKPKKTEVDKTKTKKSVNKPQKSSKQFRHELLPQEDISPKNRYYK